MLLSRSHRFLFVHVVKTGGVSIREALAPFAYHPGRSLWRRAGRRLGLATRDPLAALAPHATAAEVRAVLPVRTFDRCFKFAFVRNPWDWNVSFFHYVLQTPEHPLHAGASHMSGFGEFLAWRANHSRLLQKDFIADQDGNLLVDFVGRFEDLEEDFGKVCSTVGVRAALPHLNQSRHGDYRLHYTERTRRLVEEAWAEDVRTFGYRFDPTARIRAESGRRPLAPTSVRP
jgi:hypothetical protein